MLLKIISFLQILASIYAAEKLNVHLISHTHDDVGWLKNIDQYYYGANKTLQDGSVQYILDTVMEELSENVERKFIYVEMAFFSRWWKEQTNDMKEKVHEFIKNGQFEFINGGWCMNDEATTHYSATIDQMTLGLKFIENNFAPDARPTIGWQIDPFGHSKEQASIMSRLGFNGVFFWRFDYNDKQIRLNESRMELVWRGSGSLVVPSADIFTSIFYGGYSPPKGFCFDEKCFDDPIKDDPDLFDYNVDERVKAFTDLAFTQAKHYRTNNILVPMGSDFQYSNARMWFKNIDKLIKYVNEKNSSINLMYSTPSIYLDNVHKANLEWSIKTDDFLPNADDPYNFWTGFYSSRPSFKGYARSCNNLLQICKQLEAFTNPAVLEHPSSVTLKKAVGVSQHHDAMTGTERQHVTNDYAKRLHIGEVECQQVTSASLNAMMKKGDSPKVDLAYCDYLNLSVCPYSEISGKFNLVVYNPIARQYSWYVKFPVTHDQVIVRDSNGSIVPVQIVPVSKSTQVVRGNLSNAGYEAVVALEKSPVPSLGFSVYSVETAQGVRATHKYPQSFKPNAEDAIFIQNDMYKVEFNPDTGRLKSITNLKSGLSAMVDQQFFWYNSSTGNNINSSQSSGAYIFRPNSSDVYPVNSFGNIVQSTVKHSGDVFSEVRQTFSTWASQVVRVYKHVPAVEFEYTIGPIPFNDGLGKEIITRYDTDMATDSTFFTDSNGRELQKRVRNFRPTWKYNNTEPVSGNYYPVNSRIIIEDGDKRLCVLTDRSHGGSSLVDGSIELMIHRRILKDDNRGVVEPLNETGQYGDGLIVRGRHFLVLDDIQSSTYLHRMIGEQMIMQPLLAFTKKPISSSSNMNFSMLTHELPVNVHLLTLEYLEYNKLLLRLEHQFEHDEKPYNQNVTVSLSTLFIPFRINEVTELALGANVALSEVNRLHWKTENRKKAELFNVYNPVLAPKFDVVLSPMQIRTFNVTFDRAAE